MMNRSLKKKILVCPLIPHGWMCVNIFMKELQSKKGRGVIISI